MRFCGAGNSNASVEAAREVGMAVVVVAGRTPMYDLTAADLVVRSLDELSFINLKQLFREEAQVAFQVRRSCYAPTPHPTRSCVRENAGPNCRLVGIFGRCATTRGVIEHVFQLIARSASHCAARPLSHSPIRGPQFSSTLGSRFQLWLLAQCLSHHSVSKLRGHCAPSLEVPSIAVVSESDRSASRIDCSDSAEITM